MRSSIAVATVALLAYLGACDGRSIAVLDDASSAPDDGGLAQDTGIVEDDAGSDTAREPDRMTRLAVFFFDQHLDTVYEYAKLEDATKHLDPIDAVVWLSEEDVQTYRVGNAPSPRVQLDLTPEAAKRWGHLLDAMIDNQPFFVTLDGELLYAGVVYLIFGAGALDVPVLHVPGPERGSDPFVLKIGARQGAWYDWGKFSGDAARIDRPELRALFKARGALAPL